MRIAFISEYTDIGGGETALLALIEALCPMADPVLFAPQGELLKRASRMVEVCPTNVGRRWIKGLPLPYGRLSALAGFDLVHCYSVNAVPLTLGCRHPVVWTAHGWWEKPKGVRAWFLDRFISHAVAVSPDVSKGVSLPDCKISTIPIGSPICNEPKRRNLASPDKVVRLVCIGRFQEIKGQDLLISAIKLLTDKLPGRKLVLTLVGDINGNAPEDIAFKDRVVAAAAKLPHEACEIIFTGFRHDVAELLDEADIAVIPSRYESFSVVAIEALSRGCPIVAPDTGGPAYIVNSPKIGILFEPGSDHSLAMRLLEAIQGYENFDSAAIASRAQAFSSKLMADRHMQLYRRLLNA